MGLEPKNVLIEKTRADQLVKIAHAAKLLVDSFPDDGALYKEFGPIIKAMTNLNECLKGLDIVRIDDPNSSKELYALREI